VVKGPETRAGSSSPAPWLARLRALSSVPREMDRNATVPANGASIAPAYVFALWNLVIRPPRAVYDISQLGPAEFTVGGRRAARRDMRLRTNRGGWLQCSHFVPRQDRTKGDLRKFPVIIYLHGNSSSRLEAAGLVSPLIAQNVSLFCFDAAGCGLSDGEYVSLGWHERDDLAAVVDHLRQSPFCGPIGLWGRSMGAVTALLHADRDPALGAICLDSPFASLRRLCEELAQSDRVVFPVPSWLVNTAIALVRMRVQALADFDIEDLVPLEHASRSSVPAIFMHARQDTFISPVHSQQLYEAYAGDKELVTVEGDHNSERSEQVINHSVGFFIRAFRLSEVNLTVPAHLRDPEPQQDGQPYRVPSRAASGEQDWSSGQAWAASVLGLPGPSLPHPVLPLLPGGSYCPPGKAPPNQANRAFAARGGG